LLNTGEIRMAASAMYVGVPLSAATIAPSMIITAAVAPAAHRCRLRLAAGAILRPGAAVTACEVADPVNAAFKPRLRAAPEPDARDAAE